MFRFEPKGIARRGDENGRNRAQTHTKLPRSSLGVPRANEDAAVVQKD